MKDPKLVANVLLPQGTQVFRTEREYKAYCRARAKDKIYPDIDPPGYPCYAITTAVVAGEFVSTEYLCYLQPAPPTSNNTQTYNLL